jgi:hypothetical protein
MKHVSDAVSCPFCHDGKSKRKRGRIYEHKYFKCFNCGIYTSIIKYNKQAGIDLFSFDSIKTSRPVKIVQPVVTVAVKENVLPKSVTDKIYFNTDETSAFNISREIPLKHRQNIGYMNNFYRVQKEYLNLDYKDWIKDRRIVIVYRSKSGEIAGLNGRSMRPGEKNFKYLKFVPEYPFHYIYNYESADRSRPVVITEGEIDSMYFDNGISVGGTNSYDRSELDVFKDRIYLFDNDESGFKYSRFVLQKTDFMVFSWEKFRKNIKADLIRVKDVNDFVMKYNNGQTLLINNLYKSVVKGFKGLFEI